MSLKSYRTIGRSGLRVSPLCLGGMGFGPDWKWGVSAGDSEKIINRYIEMGGNFIDTANIYTNGHSEKIIGDVIGKHAGIRTGIVIGTKFGGNILPGNPNGGGTGAKAMIESCHQSLQRLQTDYIDLFWIHQWDWNTPQEETMRGLDHLVSSGKVRYIGISYAPAWKIAQAQTIAILKNWTPFAGLQIEYSLLQRTIEDELIPMGQELGLGIMAWAPLKGGLLSGKYNRKNGGRVPGSRSDIVGNAVALGEKELAIIDKLIDIAEAHGTTPAGVALAWVMSRSGVASTLIGVRSPEQLESNCSATDLILTDAELQALTDLSVPPSTFVTAYKPYAQMFHHGGIEVNGIKPPVLPLTVDLVQGKY